MYITQYINIKYTMDSSRRSWKPQWKIDKEKQEEKERVAAAEALKALADTEKNFPPLVKFPPVPITSKWVGKTTFKELASEWKDHAENEKVEEQRNKTLSDMDSAPAHFTFSLPKFSKHRRYEEQPEYEEDEDETEKPIVNEDSSDSGWKLVDRVKVRKVKTEEELMEPPSSPEEDGTVWKDSELHETCWDERR